ncbi:MAG: baseplate J/gp47 family protein [Candidatus Kerfeldbacteria bacterium]|nr:baseplate J/gp47 family protein [Candidatus Kerfeldbacteria bacterium]
MTTRHSTNLTPTPLRGAVSRVRSYAKYVIGFSVLVILVVIAVVYFALSRTTISATTIPQSTATEFSLTLTDTRDETPLTLQGHSVEVEETLTKSFQAFESVSEIPDTAHGTVTIVNDTTRSQPLVEQTRLLSESGVLFRTQRSITVGPRNRVDVEVKADQTGAAGNVGPTKFTIVALHPSSQSVIYGVSESAMTGGLRTASVVSKEDLDRAKDEVLDAVTKTSKTSAQTKLTEQYPAEFILDDVTSRVIQQETTNAEAGEQVESLDVTTTVRLRAVSVNRDQLQKMLTQELSNDLTEHQQLLPDSVNALYSLTVPSGSDEIKLLVRASALSDVKNTHPMFDKSKLVNLDRSSVQQYFSAFPEIQSVEVDFSPFWAFQTPAIPEHITLVINE